MVTDAHNWKSTLKRGVQRWLDDNPDTKLRERWSSIYPVSNTLGTACVDCLESFGLFLRSLRGYFSGRERNDNLVVEYEIWTAVLSLPGVPAPLFEEA